MRTGLTVTAFLLSTVATSAATFDSGAVVVLDSLLTDSAGTPVPVEVTNGTDLIITAGGAVTPVERSTAVRIEDTSTLTVEDGAVITSAPSMQERQSAGSGAVVTDQAKVTITGGAITGGAGLVGDRFDEGGNGLSLLDEADFIMSGGTITGGESFGRFGDAGHGVRFELEDHSDIGVFLLSGGTITGGAAEDDPGDGIRGDLSDGRDIEVRFTGGTVVGGASATDFGGSGANFQNGDNMVFSGTDFFGGASNGDGGGHGLELDQTETTITGGSFIGGKGQEDGGDGLHSEAAEVTITGGVFMGGESEREVGGRAIFFEEVGALGNISGGTFTGGKGGDGAGAAIRVEDNAGVLITGGTFTGGEGGAAALEVFDSVFSNLVFVSGGTFIGSVDAEGDQREAVWVKDRSKMEISGGSFNATASALSTLSISADTAGTTPSIIMEDESVLDLRGGTFGGHFELSDSAQLNVYGQKLSFNNGLLTGVLQDQTSISVHVTVSENASVNLIPAPVPLPASLPLLVAGIGAVTLMRRRNSPAAHTAAA
ncbi:MAG: VPLPA-CTERM sorting domain-containing protein [Pseudomonadota bacterium]